MSREYGSRNSTSPEGAGARTVFRRVLVVGCSRSGTTLLQGLLASHSRVHTFPETGVFLRALGMRGRLLPWAALGLTVGKERRVLARLLAAQDGSPELLPPLPPRRLSLSRSMADVVAFLDGLALANGRDTWVEKTPRHVLHARRIGRLVPRSVCIHMVRRGEDVVASMVDRARKYPDRFPRQKDPSYAIRQWNRSIRATEACMGASGHAVVVYSRLTENPEPTLRALCDALGLEFEPGMTMPANRSGYVEEEEPWKSGSGGPVRRAESKFSRVFDEATRASITADLELETYARLEEKVSDGAGGVWVP